MDDLSLTFSGELWIYEGKGAWYFITMPEDDAEQVRFFASGRRGGWGSVRVTAKIGETVWNTSIFPDSKTESYLLPVKAEVRKKEKLQAGDNITIHLRISA